MVSIARCLSAGRLISCLSVLLVSAFAFTAIETQAQTQDIDEVVLIVDDIAVTAKEYSVLHYIQTQSDSYQSFRPSLGDPATESIIDDLLLTAHARRIDPNARIEDAQVNEAIAALAARNQMSAEKLLKEMQFQGVDAEIFKSGLSQRLLVQEVLGQRIALSINVTDSEVNEYINNRPELRNQIQKRFRVSHMVVAIDEELSKKEIAALREQANEIRDRLKNGESFALVANDFDTASASGQGGDLGWMEQEELPELFVNALLPLEAGQIAPVLESNNGFHLLALKDVKSATSAPQEYQIRHIAKALPAGADALEAAAQLRNIKLQILAGLDFAALAQSYSDDASSAAKGGSLGWVQLQQLDADFAKAVQTLEVGEISDLVRSKYGLHIVQILQQRAIPGAASLDAQVRQRLFAEKLDEQMEDLLNDLKQVALVEVVES